MARDYKHRATGRKSRKTVSPLLGVTVGMLIGLFVAFLVYLKLLAPKTPGTTNGIVELAPDTGVPGDRGSTTDNGQPAPPRPRFVFYSELPEMEVIVPEEEIQAEVAKPPPPVVEKPAGEAQAPVAKPAGIYYLQAGSFKGADQADRFKAKLALMGFETDIQTITINNRDTYHRVRVGPYSDLRTLDKARSRLKQEGIEARTVKIKG
jgi:cell division protein FtsN